MDEETVLAYTNESKLDSMDKFNGYVKRKKVIDLFKNYNFHEKSKLLKQIRKL